MSETTTEQVTVRRDRWNVIVSDGPSAQEIHRDPQEAWEMTTWGER